MAKNKSTVLYLHHKVEHTSFRRGCSMQRMWTVVGFNPVFYFVDTSVRWADWPWPPAAGPPVLRPPPGLGPPRRPGTRTSARPDAASDGPARRPARSPARTAPTGPGGEPVEQRETVPTHETESWDSDTDDRHSCTQVSSIMRKGFLKAFGGHTGLWKAFIPRDWKVF